MSNAFACRPFPAALAAAWLFAAGCAAPPRPVSPDAPVVQSDPRPDVSRWSELSREGREQLRVGRYAEAEDSLVLALRAAEGMRPSDSRVATSIVNLESLASVHRGQERWQDVARVTSQLVASAARIYGEEHDVVAGQLLSLGDTLREMGDPAGAERAYERVLEIRMRRARTPDPRVASVHQRLASAALDERRFEDAEEHLEVALSIYDEQSGAPGWERADALAAFGHMRNEQGRSADAEAMFAEAIEIYERTLPPGDERIVQALSKLAWLHASRRELDAAEALLERAARATERSYGARAGRHALSLNELAWFYVETGRDDEGAETARRALNILARRPARPTDEAVILDTLATALVHTGDYEEAEDHYRRAMQLSRDSVAGDRERIEPIVRNYAALLRMLDRNDEAVEIEARLATDAPRDDDAPWDSAPEGGAESQPEPASPPEGTSADAE